MPENQVLVVEDHIPIATLLTVLAERCGAQVSRADNGRTALEMMRRQRPDLVLLDLTMPVMSGQELLAIMETDPGLRDIPVAVITTSENVDEVLERRVPHLRKPFDPAEVQRLITQMLAGVGA